jgi:hypothetical protein
MKRYTYDGFTYGGWLLVGAAIVVGVFVSLAVGIGLFCAAIALGGIQELIFGRGGYDHHGRNPGDSGGGF